MVSKLEQSFLDLLDDRDIRKHRDVTADPGVALP